MKAGEAGHFEGGHQPRGRYLVLLSEGVLAIENQ
jgi:hypothetical protein